MDNRLLLDQARRGIAAQIAQSPVVISINRYPTVDNGYGTQVPDTTQAPTVLTYTVRISHERQIVAQQQEAPAGFDTALALYLLGDAYFGGKEGETFTARGRVFKLGVVDPMIKFGGVTSYQVPLIPAGSV